MYHPRCIITGASRGIGLATATGLARMGIRVTLVTRDPISGNRAVDAIRRAVPEADTDLLYADLSRQSQVRRLAAEILERYDTIELLIHNAAIVTPERTLTEDGVETQFAVNHLAGFLLTRLLLDRIKASAPARIVVVASQVESSGRIAFDDLAGERHYDPLRAYSQSKLANVLFAYALARRLQGSGVTVNCVHPGVVRTRLLDTIGAVEESARAPGNRLTRRFLRGVQAVRSRVRNLLPVGKPADWALTPEAGAATTLLAATDPSFAGVSGRYFREGRQAESSAQSRDKDLGERLWTVSARLLGEGG